jgi:hypothetical protein
MRLSLARSDAPALMIRRRTTSQGKKDGVMLFDVLSRIRIRFLAGCSAAVCITALVACDSTTGPSNPADRFPLGPTQVRVQAAFDQNDMAIRFSWVSRQKHYPEGLNDPRAYPGQFHEMLVHNGVRFDRAPESEQIQEDRVNVMIASPEMIGNAFTNSGCYIACHTGMESHNLSITGMLDLWHWRGGRSGPMGYAEDTGISTVERIRDNLGAPPSAWIRGAGDRLREDQAALIGTGHPLAEGFPRFVFNKGKQMPGGFQIPRFFIWTNAGAVMRNPLSEVPGVTDVSVNRSLIVAYQDRTFDPVDKVNALDVGYLVHVANGSVAHLPAHLRMPGSAAYTSWTSFWGGELAIQPGQSAAAEARLREIHAEWEGSDRTGLVSRSIGFIYASSQHDITSTRHFDSARSEWVVTLFRTLNTGDPQDVNLSGLPQGAVFSLGFAVHDQGGGSESHDISLPFQLGSGTGVDIRAVQVSNVRSMDWGTAPALESRFIRREFLQMGNPRTLEWLRNAGTHQGAPYVNVVRCQSCHGVDVKRID